jgi:hypothetical protein
VSTQVSDCLKNVYRSLRIIPPYDGDGMGWVCSSTKWSYETAMNKATTIPSVSAIPRSAQRRHTPLSSVATDKAAVIKSTGRLTDAAGWTSKKPITFNAAI